MNQQTNNAVAPMSRTARPMVSIGRVKRRFAAFTVADGTTASNDVLYLTDTAPGQPSVGSSRAATASGFGETVAQQPQARVIPDAAGLSLRARAYRYAGLGEIVHAIVDATHGLGRRWVSAWKRQRAQNDTMHALRALDARTLRDIGLDPSEVRSVAMELTGATDATRAHALMRLKFLSI
jgi:uncharacterized protein YjiS (DUF1127 family)